MLRGGTRPRIQQQRRTAIPRAFHARNPADLRNRFHALRRQLVETVSRLAPSERPIEDRTSTLRSPRPVQTRCRGLVL